VVPSHDFREDVLAMRRMVFSYRMGRAIRSRMEYAVENVRNLLARCQSSDLPGASSVWASVRWKDVQAEVRAITVEPSGEESADESGRDHGAESRILCGSGIAAVESTWK
jgi:hypothetical protein